MFKKQWLLWSSLILNGVLIVLIAWMASRLGGWNYFLFRLEHDGVSGIYQHQKNLYDKLAIEKGDIVFLGNSLTAYGNWSELLSNPKIKNRGIAGDGTEGVLNRLPSITRYQPSKIFLLIGVNDLLFHPPVRILKNYRKIVQEISSASPSTKLYLQSVLPVNPKVRNMPISNADILVLNEGIRQISVDFQTTFIDLHPHFLNAQGALHEQFTLDGIHLDAEGYFVWRDILIPYLKE